MPQPKTREEMLAHLDYLESLDWNDPELIGRMFGEIAERQGEEVPKEEEDRGKPAGQGEK